MKEIQLTQGKVALVDDEDFERINKFKWYANRYSNVFYACRIGMSQNNKQTVILMHWDVTGLKWLDHIDHNGLNCQKHNLRKCTASQNCMNQRPRLNKTSKYKGVMWNKSHKKWTAQIKINRKSIHLGFFINEIDAARIYDKKAKELFKEFAYLNFP